ncbi:MAG TPA: hypothetical protein VMF03_07715 [Steroidobacteraceae bacterium]|nr:hypothetical protein [Steroidobacteraceae bacterium]
MHTGMDFTRIAAWRGALLAMALGCIGLMAVTPAVADEPAPVAAAAPHPGNFRGYSGVRWPDDFQVRSGHCDRRSIMQSPRRQDAIASLGERRALNRSAALLVGARVSDLLPSAVGPEVDEGDRACMGQVLELGASGRWVRWDNGTTGVRYEMRPDAGRDGIAGSCRAFKLKATGNYEKVKRKALACETGPGLWQLTGQ